MVPKKQPHALSSLLLFFFLALSTLSSTNAAIDCATTGCISVYWGQHTEEGSLKDTCDTGNYNIVILESLVVFDDGSTPILNLANHCGTSSNPCSKLAPEIIHCQENNIQVLLSIGLDAAGAPPPEDKDLTTDLATYLYENFLSGEFGPLGAVSLDGIDIQDVMDSRHIHWGELVTLLSDYSTADRKVYISVSPQCVYPDALLGPVIETKRVDYIWVEFYYQNPCIYDGTPYPVLSAWDEWTKNVPENSIVFLGLTAYENIAGFIKPEKLNTEILPVAKKASNYGGVMIWDRNSDKNIDYSGQIKDCVLKTSTSCNGFNSMLARS